MSKIFTMPFAAVYPLYVKKVERKGHTQEELDTVIEWLTGFDTSAISDQVERETSFEQFFDEAQLNPNAGLITGRICGIRVEEIDDPLMQKIRYMDKLVDEVANGRAMEKILRA